LQFDLILNDVGTFKFGVTPMNKLGVRVNPIKLIYGNQFQDCVNINMPAIAYILGIPDLVVSETVILRPPISNIPILRIAPIFAII
jgi:hypothetical protein